MAFMHFELLSRIAARLLEGWRRFRKNKGAAVGLFFLLFLALVAILANMISTYDPMEPGVGRMLQPPSKKFPMGTDNLGRDVFSQVVYGAQVSLMVGFVAAFTSALIGSVVGSISGYFGGAVDDTLMRFSDLFQSLPRLLFALVIVAFFGNSIWNVVVVIGFLSWPRTARMVRSEFLRLREKDFVMAAKSIGIRSPRIIFRHILPNVLHIIIVTASLEVGSVILMEAGLSFLGAGDPNLMSWGQILHNAQSFLRKAWWFSAFPGLAIFLTVLSLNLVGDGLNDALNPRLKRMRQQ